MRVLGDGEVMAWGVGCRKRVGRGVGKHVGTWLRCATEFCMFRRGGVVRKQAISEDFLRRERDVQQSVSVEDDVLVLTISSDQNFEK